VDPLTTPLCRLLGIRVPVVQGALGGPWGSSVELAAAVARAGGLGTIATALQPAERVRRDIAAVRERTEGPFAANHTMRPFEADVFDVLLAERVPVITFALGLDPELIRRSHDVGARFVQQIHTVEQAEDAAEAGADVIVAQGDEAGGFGGGSGLVVLLPQVVDAVAPLPVVAAGGIVDGRGLAAALAFGAAGIQMGTRFLASDESEIDLAYRQAVLDASSERTVRASFVNRLVPPPAPGAFDVAPRVARNEFVETWLGRDEALAADLERVRAQVRDAIAAGRAHEFLPVMGASAGLIHDVVAAGAIVERVVAEARSVLASLAST
jgi:nitronate monooxygenase/enoyl-[acyl-carrier protein] reductase II